MLKDFYRFINPEAFEVCYESMIQNLKMQRDAGLEGTDEWPHVKPTGPGWFMTGGVKPGYTGPLKPYTWGMQPEVEAEMMKQFVNDLENQDDDSGDDGSGDDDDDEAGKVGRNSAVTFGKGD